VFAGASPATRHDFAVCALAPSSHFARDLFSPVRLLGHRVALRVLDEATVPCPDRLEVIRHALQTRAGDTRPLVAHLLAIADSQAERVADRTRAIQMLCEAKILTRDQATGALKRLHDDPALDAGDQAGAAAAAITLARDADTLGRDLLRRAIATRDRAMLSAVIEARGIDPVRDPELAVLCADGDLAAWLKPSTLAAKKIGMHLDRRTWLPIARSVAAGIGTEAYANDSAWSTTLGENHDLIAWLAASTRRHKDDVIDLLADVAGDAGRGPGLDLDRLAQANAGMQTYHAWQTTRNGGWSDWARL
jgi:hypothetical protein